jgi:8-oxo-dGTP pyrophosphatase MutT (NUDIX family)
MISGDLRFAFRLCRCPILGAKREQMNTATARHSVSVAGVITDDDGRALLIRRRDTLHWEPPGGVLELDESIEAGLRREVREETG